MNESQEAEQMIDSMNSSRRIYEAAFSFHFWFSIMAVYYFRRGGFWFCQRPDDSKTIHSFTGNQNLQTFLINTREEVVSVRCSLCFSPRICLFDASFRATLSCFNTSKQSSAQTDPVESKIFRTWRFLPCFYGYVCPFRESHVDSFKSNRVEQLFPKHRLWLSLLYPGAEPVLIAT